MSTNQAATQDSRSAEAAKRRKRKERAATARPPEPKQIVSGAGQPLDLGVRRELEERLGHDFSRVRLHTDRDAGALAELVGADAVTVGQDIFFREGTYRPGTADGQRLLAHELLHTVQNPDGLGALRAGRDLGAVSLPQQAIEREAESAAQDSVREGERPADVRHGQATPGWLRYATVDADRARTEKLDPATLVDRLSNGILRSLRGDPTDASGRVRLQLSRFSPELQDSVLDRLEKRLPTPDHERLLEMVEEAERGIPGLQPMVALPPVADTVEQDQAEDERLRTAAEGGRKQKERTDRDAREERRGDSAGAAAAEQDSGGAQDSGGSAAAPARGGGSPAAQRGPAQQAQQQQRDTQAEKKAADEARQQQDERAEDADKAKNADQAKKEQQEKEQEEAKQAEEEKEQQRTEDDKRQKEQDKEKSRKEKESDDPGSDKRKRREDEQGPAKGSRREEVDPKAKGQPGRVRADRVDEQAEARDSALSRHGLNEKDEDEGDPREEEQPIGLEAGSDRDIEGGEADQNSSGGGKGDVELKPEDFIPDADLDVSSVPTADRITLDSSGSVSVPEAPAFSATPPPTKAEQIEQAREEEEDDEEAEEEPDAEAKAPGAERGPVEGEAPQPESGPAADAGDRSEKDLQPEKATDQEVGPDPETAERQDAEPEAEDGKDSGEQQDAEEDGTKAATRDQDDEEGNDEDGRGEEDKPEAKDAAAEEKDTKERKEQQERRDAKSTGAAAASAVGGGGPTASAGPASSATALGAARRPAGARTEPTPIEDRHPSPAVRRAAEPTKGTSAEGGPQAQAPNPQGAGAAPAGPVGDTDKPAGPSSAAGPGGAPRTMRAAVSPAAEQAENPGNMAAPEGTKTSPEASLEKDGGGCAGAPESTTGEQDGEGKTCGGGGGGGQEQQEKQPEPPDVSGQDPKAALETVSQLPPDQAQAALPGVDAAAEKKTNEERQELAANPPTRERPSGAPQTQSGPPETAPPADPVTGKVEEVQPEEQGDQQKAKGGDKADGRKPTEDVAKPHVASGTDGKVSAESAKNIEAAADQVPTTDPELYKTVGPAPPIKLEGESDPKRTDKQAEKLKEKQSQIRDTGREDAAKPLGEDQIFPDVPKEQLRGDVHGGGGGGGGQAAAAGPRADQGVAVVAKQERGSEVKAAAGTARGEIATKEKEHQRSEQQQKREKQQEIDQEVAKNAEAQAGERGQAAEQAKAERVSWREEQDRKLEDADRDSEKEHRQKNQDITKKREEKDKEVQGRKDHDNEQIVKEREKAEQEAEKKKEEKKNEGGGFLGWVADKVGDFFDALISAVTWIFDQARKAINGLIEGFKKFLNEAIDLVRDFAIQMIKAVATALIAIGDVLLAAFPELRDKFRKKIEELRDKAIAKVNEWADKLKAAVNKLLDLLAAGLNKLLDVLEAGIKGAIEIYRKAIVGAIKFAQQAIAALGKFAALVADIAPDPGGWLSKLGSSAKAGIQDHLWGAIKTGVKRWFDEKVEGILGLGKTIINVLVKGCVSIKQIGKMAWDALVASLPMMIASIVIEKVVSMLVPAAGAILTIVQGLMAAWDTIGKIMTAFGKFWAYLKAVKAGPAACLFAEAVAAGVVALLDFITNFLLQRLKGAAKGVGNRLKAMAQKIAKGLKKTGKGARKAAGGAVNRARGAMRKAAQALRRPDGPSVQKGPRVPGRRSAPTDRTPGARRPAGRGPDHRNDRPSSRRPDRERDLRHERDRERDERRNAAPGRQPERPDTRRPGDRTPDSKRDKAPDRTPDKPKRKEIEAPKRAKPRKAKSPLGRALKKVKKSVKSALRKVRNAGRALGKKLRNSKVGKALSRSAKRLRDAFKRKRDWLRDRRKLRRDQRKQQREDRRKKENSKESKEARLQKIIARIRPKLERLLTRGIPRPIMQAVLASQRVWYRLTGLSLQKDSPFEVIARLNPQHIVIGGVSVDSLVVLEDLERMVTRGMDRQRRGHGSSGPTATPAATRPGPGNPTAFLTQLTDAPNEQKNDIQQHNFPEGSRVTSRQGAGFQSNKLFYEGDQSAGTAERYPQMSDFIARHPVGEQTFAAGLQSGVYGDTQGIAGLPQDARGKARFLGSLLSGLEAFRNRSALAINLMAVRMAAEGRQRMSNLLERLPMSPRGAQRRGREVTFMIRMWQIVGDSKYRRESFDPTTMTFEEAFRRLDIPGRFAPKKGFRGYPEFLNRVADPDKRNRLAMMHALSEGLGINYGPMAEMFRNESITSGARSRDTLLENLGNHLTPDRRLGLDDLQFTENTMRGNRTQLGYVKQAEEILDTFLSSRTLVRDEARAQRFYQVYLARIERLLFGGRSLP